MTFYFPRQRLHQPGSFVGIPAPRPRTSRWRAGPTSFGPAGRIACTIALVAFFPWWGLGSGFNPLFLWGLMGWLLAAGVVLRNVWKPERIVDPVPTRIERLHARHPLLGRQIHLTHGMRLLILVVAACGASAAWLSLDDVARYVWVVIAIVAGLGVFLSTWNGL